MRFKISKSMLVKIAFIVASIGSGVLDYIDKKNDIEAAVAEDRKKRGA